MRVCQSLQSPPLNPCHIKRGFEIIKRFAVATLQGNMIHILGSSSSPKKHKGMAITLTLSPKSCLCPRHSYTFQPTYQVLYRLLQHILHIQHVQTHQSDFCRWLWNLAFVSISATLLFCTGEMKEGSSKLTIHVLIFGRIPGECAT